MYVARTTWDSGGLGSLASGGLGILYTFYLRKKYWIYKKNVAKRPKRMSMFISWQNVSHDSPDVTGYAQIRND